MNILDVVQLRLMLLAHIKKFPVYKNHPKVRNHELVGPVEERHDHIDNDKKYRDKKESRHELIRCERLLEDKKHKVERRAGSQNLECLKNKREVVTSVDSVNRFLTSEVHDELLAYFEEIS